MMYGMTTRRQFLQSTLKLRVARASCPRITGMAVLSE
jgi:hypothetical protein